LPWGQHLSGCDRGNRTSPIAALDARYVVEGSVQKAGKRVRISAQPADVDTGVHLWAERYDRELGDIFALQDNVTAQVVSALSIELTAPRDRGELFQRLTNCSANHNPNFGYTPWRKLCVRYRLASKNNAYNGRKSMIEVTVTWELRPGIDLEAYAAFAKNAVSTALQAPGIVEVRAQRGLLAPQVRATYVWQSLADWGKFQETGDWQELMLAFNSFAANIDTQLWGPSPIMPEPVRP
jgi:hypothetical protein